MTTQGRIIRSLSGFYEVETASGPVTCRGRGSLRRQASPLTGDLVEITVEHGKGMVEKILPRRNRFIRPAVANVDALAVFAANVNPVTEPFLIDRVAAIAADQQVSVYILVNKCDLDAGEKLAEIYRHAGFPVIQTSAETGQGIEELRKRVDSLVIIPNERLKYATDQKITFANAFEIADDVLRQAVQSISDLIRDTGFINLDFADVTTVMKDAGLAHMGVGRAAGKGKAEEAAKMAISSPLLETSINGAHGVLINVTGSMDIGLEEVEQAASLVQDAVHPDAVTIFGATFDESLEDEIRVTVIATGFAENKPEESQPGAQTTAQPAQASQPAAAQQPAPQPAVSQQAQQLNESVDQEARAARESIDRAYEDIFRIFSKDK